MRRNIFYILRTATLRFDFIFPSDKKALFLQPGKHKNSFSLKKIAIVVQRYGNEVNGGAEYHARILAEHLAGRYHVTILTTTALDYFGWPNHYAAGETVVNGLPVIRFATLHTISGHRRRKAYRAIFGRKKYFKILRRLGLFDFLNKKFDLSRVTQRDIDDFLFGQGPYCPELIDYIKNNADEYDVFIFFTYLYYPTVAGMPVVSAKVLFIPTAHDEEVMFTKPYENIFAVPRFIMYNTESEQRLVERRFARYCKNTDVAGVGIDEFVLEQDYLPGEELRFDFPYFVYIGRIETNKGCAELIDYFNRFSEKHPAVKLVMIGKDFLGVEPSDNILLTGFIDEKDKYYLLKNSLGLILPSRYESLSLVTLEAMIQGKIVVVNGGCEVLKVHIDKSDAGFYYTDYPSFEQTLTKVIRLSEEERSRFASKAKQYVTDHYTWGEVLTKFDKAIDFITQPTL